ncbi:UNVERIFIED_ORG: L-2,4-diaminobutyrate transaminase [Burkholderia sp. CF145]|uniref:aminotransferase n=1 Tax=Paraburkholderia hospita TaxID=169430 RepID=UPI0002719346|nr:aminotransferase [Paraburkholderia hospita]EUC20695.1 Acetylornithine transaminase [Burkholderia sp. BT03]SKC45525.1 L-2,4-diaminobutyrate transaminase [Paraburkholderia hospita]
MTARERLLAMDRAHLMHPSTHAFDHAHGAMQGTIFTGGSGITIEDSEGRTYIDAFAGLYCVNIGYGRDEVADAMHRQAKKLAFYHTFFGQSNDPAIELSERILSWMPSSMKKVFYGLSGSDANETQIKLVWYYNNVKGRLNKKKIIARDRSYHGSGLFTGSLTGLPSFHNLFDLPVDGIHHTVCPHWYRHAPDGMDELQFTNYCVHELEKLIEAEGADTIAAFIAEPVMGTGGIVPPPRGYWDAIQRVLTKHDILLICDEVVCGFGRVGAKTGSDLYGIRPDLITVAKGLTSGYAPLSAVVVSDAVWEVIEQGSRVHGVMGHGWTYSGHPVSAAAGLANLDILERENLTGNAEENGAYLQSQLHAYFGAHPLVGEVRGVGMLAAVEFMRDSAARTPFEPNDGFVQKVVAAARQRGLIVRALPHGDILGFAPPLCTSRSEVDEIVRIAAEAFEAVTETLELV